MVVDRTSAPHIRLVCSTKWTLLAPTMGPEAARRAQFPFQTQFGKETCLSNHPSLGSREQITSDRFFSGLVPIAWTHLYLCSPVTESWASVKQFKPIASPVYNIQNARSMDTHTHTHSNINRKAHAQAHKHPRRHTCTDTKDKCTSYIGGPHYYFTYIIYFLAWHTVGYATDALVYSLGRIHRNQHKLMSDKSTV